MEKEMINLTIDGQKISVEKGTTILFVSHATEQVKRFCNKAIWLKDGKIKMDGNTKDVVEEYISETK